MSLWSSPYRRRWLLWGVLAASFLLVNVYRLSTAVIAEDLMTAFRTTGTQLGTLHATFFFVYAAMQIPTGVLVDRIGPRLTAATGAVVMNLGAIWFALASGYGGALVGRLLIGLGGSVIFVSMLRFSANWFRADEFATLNGLSFAVGGVGGILATTPFALLVGATGWREAVLALAAVGLVFAVATALFVRDTAERAGFAPIDGATEQSRLTVAEVRTSLAVILRDRWTWIVSLLLFCTGGVNLTLFGLWGIPFVVQIYDVSVTAASTITLLGGAGLVVGPPVIGRLSDRLDRRSELIVAGTVVYAALLGAIAVLGEPPLAFVGVAFFLAGALLGSFVLTYPMIKERNPSRASGISLGTINGASFFGAAAFPSIMGWTLDAYWTGEMVGGVRVYTLTGYRIAFAIAAGAGVVSVACATWVHWNEPGR